MPELLRHREDEAVVEEARSAVVGVTDSLPAQGGDDSAEVIDAEIVAEASTEQLKPAAAATGPQATPMASDELQTGIAPEPAAPSASPTPRRTRNQSAAAPAPAPPADPSGPASPSVGSVPATEQHPNQAPPADNSDPVELGLRQIPRITTLLELDTAYARVNQLLSAGRINDENAERLWSAIARRRHQLEDAETAATQVPEAGA